jgi:ATP-dependent Clp protease ATP-binding subunit ClpC
LVLAPSGTETERRFVMERLASIDHRLSGEDWLASKEGLLVQMNRAGFWTGADRHSVLARIELMDRIEAGAEAARSLSRRLDTRAERHISLPRQMLANLAQQLYLLEGALADLDAGGSSDVFLSVEPVATEPGAGQADPGWPLILGGMYREWGRKRRMRITVLRDGRTDPQAQLLLIAISGFGVHHILSREAGLHLLEVPDANGGFHRHTARIRVVQQPLRPKPPQQSELEFAVACLAAAGAGSNAVVRRYRQQPSPLVRDSAAGWRTGRLDLVLGGDFDLIQ